MKRLSMKCPDCGIEVQSGGTITVNRSMHPPRFLYGKLMPGDSICQGCLAICRNIFGPGWSIENVIQRKEILENPKRTVQYYVDRTETIYGD